MCTLLKQHSNRNESQELFLSGKIFLPGNLNLKPRLIKDAQKTIITNPKGIAEVRRFYCGSLFRSNADKMIALQILKT